MPVIKSKQKFSLSGKIRAGVTKLSKRPLSHSFIVGAIPAMLILYFGYTLFISGFREDNRSLRASVEQTEAENTRNAAVEAQETEFKNEFRRVVSLLDEAAPLLPSETELSNILAGVQRMAVESNVSLTGLNAVAKPIPSANAPRLYEREIPASVTGRYDDCIKFLDKVSHLERILVIRDFTADSAKTRQASGNVRPDKVSLGFSLIAFHAPPPSDFPPVPPDIKPPLMVSAMTGR